MWLHQSQSDPGVLVAYKLLFLAWQYAHHLFVETCKHSLGLEDEDELQ